MSDFQECALLVFARIGLGAPPAAYLDDLERLQRAASEWHRLPDQERGGVLHFEVPDLLTGNIVTGNLPEAIAQGWCRNEATKAFVRFIDERSGRKATLLMLQVIILIQEAVGKNHVNSFGGAG